MIGGVKIWKELNDNGIKGGRDELYKWLRQNDLLVKHKKQYVRTTDSSKWLKQFPNRVKGLEINRPNQVWVSDITYLNTLNGFVFLSLVTDAYSRRIVGYHVHKDLSTQGPLKAVYKAFTDCDIDPLKKLIHHSDRGCQYCSGEYVETLSMKGIAISTTQDGSPYDNMVSLNHKYYQLSF